MEDYAFFVQNTDKFCQRLLALVEIRGKAVVDGWITSVLAGNIAPVVQELLTQHYDPVYIQSMRRNFAQFESARVIAPEDHSMQSMSRLAQQIVEGA